MTNTASTPTPEPTGRLRRWMQIVGAFYPLQFVMLVVVRAPIRTFGPEGTLDRAAQGDDLARFVVDTWTFFGLEMLAVGVVLLLATRWGQLASGAIAIEVSRGIVADLSQVVRGVHVGGYAVWILIHSVLLLTGAHCLRDARRHADGPVTARSGSAAAAQA